jgi:hypothetical protein
VKNCWQFNPSSPPRYISTAASEGRIWVLLVLSLSLSRLLFVLIVHPKTPRGFSYFYFFPYRLSDLVTTSWAAHLIDCNTPHHSKSNKVGVHTIHDPLW